MIDKDQQMRDRIASLDHVKPPTNWNPNNTWKRIHPGIPYRRRAVWLIAASVMAFLIAFLIFTQNPHAPALVKGVEKEKPQELVQSRSAVVEPSDEERDNQKLVLKSLVDTSAHQEPIATPKYVAKADVSQPPNEELPPPITLPDSLEKEVLVVKNDDVEKLPFVDSLPIETPPNSQKPKINLNITIAIHSDKPPKQNVVKKSIIKVNGSQDFTADKKFYTVQLFK